MSQLLVTLLLVLPAPNAPDEEPESATLMQAILIINSIESLSASTWEERERAFFNLRFFGKKALPFLKSAAGKADFQSRLKIDYLLNHVPAQQEMLSIPGGTVNLGTDDDACNNPLRTRKLSSFEIDKYEVTNFMYSVFVDRTGFPPPASWEGGKVGIGSQNLPVTGITFHDAKAFALWAGKRLPFSDEWEYAARGPDSRLFPWGNEVLRNVANINNLDTFEKEDVGSHERDKSLFGCMDMGGNVVEWVVLSDPNGGIRSACKGSAFNRAWRRPDSFSCCGPVRKQPDSAARDRGFRCAR